MTTQSKPRIFYGYYLVAVTFILMILFSGCGVFAFSLFVRPLEASLGWGRGQVMAGFTLFYLMVGFASPVAGRFVDRYGARPVIPVGAILMGLGFALVSWMSQLHLFYLGYIIIGIGAAAMGLVPCSAVISNWFKRKRGTALGLMAGGVGAGGVVIAPFVGYMLSHYDWRAAYLSMGILTVALAVPLSLLLIRTKPAEKGLYPDGASGPDADAAAALRRGGDMEGIPLHQALRTRTFWLIAAALALSNFANMGTIQSAAPFMEDIGYPTAATAISAMGLGSAVGKVFFGWLCDRIAANRACAIGIAMQLTGVLLILTVRPDSPVALVLCYTLVLGLGVGSWLPTLSMLASSHFGLLYYGAVFGALNMAQSTGTATGPLFTGSVFDATGSYFTAFITAAVVLTVAIPTVLLVRRPDVPADGGSP